MPYQRAEIIEPCFEFVVSASSWVKKNIQYGHREFYFSANNEEEREEWIVTIEYMKTYAVQQSFQAAFGADIKITNNSKIRPSVIQTAKLYEKTPIDAIRTQITNPFKNTRQTSLKSAKELKENVKGMFNYMFAHLSAHLMEHCFKNTCKYSTTPEILNENEVTKQIEMNCQMIENISNSVINESSFLNMSLENNQSLKKGTAPIPQISIETSNKKSDSKISSIKNATNSQNSGEVDESIIDSDTEKEEQKSEHKSENIISIPIPAPTPSRPAYQIKINHCSTLLNIQKDKEGHRKSMVVGQEAEKMYEIIAPEMKSLLEKRSKIQEKNIQIAIPQLNLSKQKEEIKQNNKAKYNEGKESIYLFSEQEKLLTKSNDIKPYIKPIKTSTKEISIAEMQRNKLKFSGSSGELSTIKKVSSPNSEERFASPEFLLQEMRRLIDEKFSAIGQSISPMDQAGRRAGSISQKILVLDPSKKLLSYGHIRKNSKDSIKEENTLHLSISGSTDKELIEGDMDLPKLDVESPNKYKNQIIKNGKDFPIRKYGYITKDISSLGGDIFDLKENSMVVIEKIDEEDNIVTCSYKDMRGIFPLDAVRIGNPIGFDKQY